MMPLTSEARNSSMQREEELKRTVIIERPFQTEVTYSNTIFHPLEPTGASGRDENFQ